MGYIPIIGLEIHVQLSTKTKLFCSCARKISSELYGTDQGANLSVCPVCLGLPGAMPFMNAEAVEKAVRVGLGLNCSVNDLSIWDRKNYMYPDLFTGYQISQMDNPLNIGGYVDISNKRIRVNRAHLENDAAKSQHKDEKTLLDANKSGVPLVEIVSEPDMRNAEEAKEYAEKVRQIVRWVDGSDADMYLGELKFDINVSLCVEGDPENDFKNIKHTPIVEVKNRNSFKELVDVINYEIKRQTQEYDQNGKTYTKGSKVTMGWDEVKGVTFLQREKEESDDYKYFHEPDVPPVHLTEEYLDRVRSTMPEPMEKVIDKIVSENNADKRRVSSLVGDRDLYKYFLSCVAQNDKYKKQYVDWIMSDISNVLTLSEQDIQNVRLQPNTLVAIVEKVENNLLNRGVAHDLLVDYIDGFIDYQKSVDEIIEEKSLGKVTDTNFIEEIVKKVVDANPKVIEEIKSGKENAKQFIIGKVMGESKGKADINVVKSILDKLLS